MKDKIFYHNAYFWLNNPLDANEKDYFSASLKKFLDLNAYTASAVVTQPPKTPKGVVNSGYTFCLLVTFKNKEQYDLYQNDNTHLEFVKNVGHLWRKVEVFDSVEMWNINVSQEIV